MLNQYLAELLKVRVYNPNLGKTARRCTFLGLAVLFVAGAFAAWRSNLCGTPNATAVVALLIAVLGLWISWRTVQFPVFADFLVSVESEMRKVYWPSKKELNSTSKVVLLFMAMFVVILYFYDLVFSTLFSWLDFFMK